MSSSSSSSSDGSGAVRKIACGIQETNAKLLREGQGDCGMWRRGCLTKGWTGKPLVEGRKEGAQKPIEQNKTPASTGRGSGSLSSRAYCSSPLATGETLSQSTVRPCPDLSDGEREEPSPRRPNGEEPPSRLGYVARGKTTTCIQDKPPGRGRERTSKGQVWSNEAPVTDESPMHHLLANLQRPFSPRCSPTSVTRFLLPNGARLALFCLQHLPCRFSLPSSTTRRTRLSQSHPCW